MNKTKVRKLGVGRSKTVLENLLTKKIFYGGNVDYSADRPESHNLIYMPNGFEIKPNAGEGRTADASTRYYYAVGSSLPLSWHWEMDPRILLVNSDRLLTWYASVRKKGRIEYEYLNFKLPYEADSYIEMMVERGLPAKMTKFRSAERRLIVLALSHKQKERVIEFRYP